MAMSNIWPLVFVAHLPSVWYLLIGTDRNYGQVALHWKYHLILPLKVGLHGKSASNKVN